MTLKSGNGSEHHLQHDLKVKAFKSWQCNKNCFLKEKKMQPLPFEGIQKVN
jgi:hypothetical protein